jgi:hypothetical protein
MIRLFLLGATRNGCDVHMYVCMYACTHERMKRVHSNAAWVCTYVCVYMYVSQVPATSLVPQSSITKLKTEFSPILKCRFADVDVLTTTIKPSLCGIHAVSEPPIVRGEGGDIGSLFLTATFEPSCMPDEVLSIVVMFCY